MSKNFILLTLLSISFLSESCNKKTCCAPTPPPGNWVTLYPGTNESISEASSFVIGNNAFIGTGMDSTLRRLNYFWQYNTATGAWNQIANFPGTARSSAIAFSIGNYGYLGTGYDGARILNDFWQYDVIANTWTRKADFGGVPRYNAVGFSIGNTGYVTTGASGISYLKDFWEYNPMSDSWTEDNDFPGLARSEAVTFVYNNQAYIVTGVDTSGNTAAKDFWRFDPSKPDSAKWHQLRDIYNNDPASYDDGYADIARWNAAAFVINGIQSDAGEDRAFITTGRNGSVLNSTWSYSFISDLWNQVNSFEGKPREGAVGFNANNKGFAGTGNNGSIFYNEIREFNPDDPYNVKD